MFKMFKRRDEKLNIDEKWFNSLKKDIEESYLRHKDPWKQAGFMLTEEAWTACRKPIADCLEKSGTFLDIGCANGYLVESILKWTSERGLNITPYGIDLSEKLIVRARERLPQYSSNLNAGDALNWSNPIKFDYVRTELAYALEDSQEQYLHKIFTSYLEPNGKLLLTEYRLKQDSPNRPWMNEKINRWEFKILNQASGYYEGIELTRVLVLTR
jgi:SAM-dependent methyltransferase